MKVVVTFKKGNTLLEIFNRAGVGWTVTKYSENGDRLRKLFVKGFKTKSSAVKFAMNYMQKN